MIRSKSMDAWEVVSSDSAPELEPAVLHSSSLVPEEEGARDAVSETSSQDVPSLVDAASALDALDAPEIDELLLQQRRDPSDPNADAKSPLLSHVILILCVCLASAGAPSQFSLAF